jgi:diguanylate cyclase (GGDEF)-like protein/PAS domain S-box-containing protein
MTGLEERMNRDSARVLLEEKARLLFQQAPISNATVIVVASLYYLLLDSRVDAPVLKYWVIALCLSATIRMALWWWRERKPEIRNARQWLHLYLAGSVLVGVSWSVVFPQIYLSNDLTVAIALSMLLFGIVSSAVVILAVYLPVFVVYVYPQVLALVATLLAFGDVQHAWLAVAVLVYLVMTTLFVRNLNRNLMQSITLQSLNGDLIRELGEEVRSREDEIRARTLELQEKNASLENEIAEREQIQAALRKSEQRFELAMRGANDGLFDWDLAEDRIYYSPRWKDMLGYRDDELPNEFSTWENLIDQADRDRSWAMLYDYMSGRRNNFHIEFRMRHKGGHWVDILSRAFMVRDENGKAIRVVGTHVDISEKKQQEARILHQAQYDSLTGLPNRYLAMDRLAQLQKEGKRKSSAVAVLFLDLDGFKWVNDTLGHETGDDLLVQAAKRLCDVVRDVDSVCRLGGDEFVVLLGDIMEPGDAEVVAGNLVAKFREPFAVREHELLVTTSIGIAMFPEHGAVPAELLRNADTAMYFSKESGRNTYHFFTRRMNHGVSRRLEIEEQIHGALSRGEFSVHYQPVIRLQDNKVVSAEALLRWQNPVLGSVAPDEFIPIAEQTGAINEIGQYVLRKALEDLACWRASGNSEFTVAVNFSPRQFRSAELVTDVEERLSETGVPPESLALEITEGVLISGQEATVEALVALRSLGIRTALDDFGTGYSSLSYLRKYPFDLLKIDRSFVNDIIVDPADHRLVSATVSMAHGLGLEVVAEGVETAEQLERLRDIDCEYAQGYVFSEPLSHDAFTEYLARYEV